MITKLLQPLSPYARQYAIVIAINICVLSTGLGLAWTSPNLVKLSEENSTIVGRPITTNEGSWIVSVGFIGGFCANILAGFLSDRIGRKYAFILAAVPKIGFGLMMTIATEVWMVIVGRLLFGMSETFTLAIVPAYSSEIASKEIRGRLGILIQIFISLGMLLMLSVGPFLEYRVLNLSVLIISVLTSIQLIFLPDSPYFLYKKGKTDEATEVLTFLRGSTELATDEIKEYQIMDSSTDTVSLREIFESKTVLKAFGLVLTLGMGMQLTGFNAVQYYLQTIFESTGVSISSAWSSVIVGLIQFFASLCTTVIIDRFGRKIILTVTLTGYIIGIVSLGTFFYIADSGTEITGFLNYLPLISVALVVACYGAGLGSLAWLIMSELFDSRFRALGMMSGVSATVTFVFLTTLFFPPVIESIGPAATYWIFGFFTICLCLFILFCIPETRGRSFVEIQKALEGKGKKADVEEKNVEEKA